MKFLLTSLCLCVMVSLSVQWFPKPRHTRPPRYTTPKLTTTTEPTTTTEEPTTTTEELTTTTEEPTTTTEEPTTTTEEPTTTTEEPTTSTVEITTKESLIDLILEGLKKKFEATLEKILRFKKEEFHAILRGLVKLGKAAAREILEYLHEWLLRHHDLPEEEDTRVQQMMTSLQTYIEHGEDEDDDGLVDLILTGLKNKFEETIQKVIEIKKEKFKLVVKNVARLGKAAARKILGHFSRLLDGHYDLPGDGALRVSEMMGSLQAYVDHDEDERTFSRSKRFVGRIIDGLIKKKVEIVHEVLVLKKEKFVAVVKGLGKLAKGVAGKVLSFFGRYSDGQHDLPGDGALRISEMMGALETAAENNPDDAGQDDTTRGGSGAPFVALMAMVMPLLPALLV